MDSLEAFEGSYNEKLIKHAMEMHIPLSGTFELLPTCNMRCRMCYIQHTPNRSELQPVQFWVELFEQCIAEGLLYPLLTGGEPFIYPGFMELYEKLIRMPIHLAINTNATLLDRDMVAWLAKMPPRRLNISLYGASDETYARLCGNPNGFTQVMHAFELLNEYGIQFRVHSSLVPENIGDYQGIIDTCNRVRAPLSMANYMFPPFRKDGTQGTNEGRFSPEELAQTSLRYMKDHFTGREREYWEHVALLCVGMEHPEYYSLYGRNDVACKSGRCTYWVDWRGNVSACGLHNQSAIDLKMHTFREAWARIVEDTSEVRISEQCRNCRYRCICPICPAAAFCETGCMSQAPEYLCAYCEAYGKLLFEERDRLQANGSV